MTRRVLAPLALLLATVFALSGCGGSSGGGGGKAAPSASDRLAAAQKFLADAKGVTVDLSTDKLPQGTQGILKAKGVGTQVPAFEGTISVVQSGLSIEVPVIAVGGKTYIKFGGAWRTIDPATFGAPDPAGLFAPGKGFSTLLSDVKDATSGGKTRDGKRVLSTITGKVPGSSVATIIPGAGKTDFDATFTLDDDDHLVKAVLKGPFYPKSGEDTTYTIGFSGYGGTKEITAP